MHLEFALGGKDADGKRVMTCRVIGTRLARSSHSHFAILQQMIPDFAPVVSADDINVQLAACLAGAGVMLLPQVLQQYSRLPHMRQLVPLDVGLGPAPAGEMFLVCHKRQRDLPKIQTVIELLRDEFARMRGEP